MSRVFKTQLQQHRNENIYFIGRENKNKSEIFYLDQKNIYILLFIAV
jgi:hypothetical protein